MMCYFPILILLIYFSCLNLAGESFNRINNNRQPCLISDFKGDAVNISPLKMRFAVDTLYQCSGCIVLFLL